MNLSNLIMEKKVYFLLALIFLGISLLTLKYSGFTVINSPSKVSIDEGIIVLYDEFTGSATTQFIYMNDTTLENISEMTLENDYGKIIWKNLVNLTQDAKINIVDLNSNIEFSYNSLIVNVDELTSLNKTAELYIYLLNFTNPRILRNGEICPLTQCQKITYSGGNLVFSVTELDNANYSSEETPSTPIPPIPSGGGTSGGAASGGGVTQDMFNLSTDLIKVNLKQGETKKESFVITNIWNKEINITLKAGEIGDFILINEESFSLKPNEAKTVELTIYSRENDTPDSYIGEINVSSGVLVKKINMMITIESRKSIFDIKTIVLDKKVYKGEDVKANIILFNLGEIKPIEANLYYAIKNFNDEEIVSNREKVVISDSLNLEKELKLPENVQLGSYVFYSRITYGNISAATSDNFEVIAKPIIYKINWLLILILILSILLLAYLIYRKLREKSKKGKYFDKNNVLDLFNISK
jgi:hypothetical protein